ncbi:hypothetical protein ASPACDRAFT_1856455 [Aspergillus aculeatus ATCC 16872]|uniref:FAD-binding domain-containing protein n=1 Tax=Aspergillus aculeatus (strain ATCC 16872 / CBS 172.66 / WB 5094) TaxID=690307 RepID=A0A1L9WUR9_ASPA1|nr:uncharacterized protein ASPACDRAFT_1856455 [Aspergillus aculeatus ATCC 16872]OJJ99878.1 hypothetical protein ASPACDRAFT_1856455 [Aspergillus aculeatus ATCC 16872]
MSSTIRIVVSDGGLAGAPLLHALLPHKHLDVRIFESASAFREAGMAVGITRNALAASSSLAYQQCNASKQWELFSCKESDLCWLKHCPPGSVPTGIAIRLPPERMHASKKLERFDLNGDGSLTLHFADGTSHECDILIGADGLRSTVRRLILREDEPAAFPRNTSAWCVMTLQPSARAQARICTGPGSIENDAREYMWIGDRAYLLHNVLHGGELMQVVISSYRNDAESSDRWHRTVSADEIKELYHKWPPHLSRALFCEQPKQPAMYIWEHPPTTTYVAGPVWIVGDAAHATTPWQGSGAGISIEDSLILSTLLGRASTTAEARTAWQAYDQVRRLRTQRIVESSRATGLILCGSREETRLGLRSLRSSLLPRWDFIVDCNNKKDRNEAVELMERALKP